MARILDVPYRSQWDDDANKSNTDCGPACLAMILGYFGKQASINELLTATGVAPGRYVGFGQLQRAARDYGVTFEYGANYELNDLKRWIDEGKPAIALIKYSYWSQIEPRVSTQDTFTGPHFVVVVGYGDGNIYVNDPNYWPPRREEGHSKAWSEVLFNLAWSNVRTRRTPNPNNSVIFPAIGRIGDSAADTVTPSQPVILGQGALQTVEANLVWGLKEKWISEGKVAAGADEITVLRTFVDEVNRWDAGEQVVIEYVVQPGDTWAGIASRFLGDQTRFQEIIEFNRLPAGPPPRVGHTLRIPPK